MRLSYETPGTETATPTVEDQAAASVQLPFLTLRFPEALQSAARSVLPSNDVHVHPAQVWAPVLAWIALRALPSPVSALKIYDALQLRHALAGTFSAVGIHGEDAWRAAARMRVLLAMKLYGSSLAAIRSAEFWRDPDVRWLTGVHGAVDEPEYFDESAFEAFVCWLQLPALINGTEHASLRTKAANEVTAIAANLAYSARVVSYNLQRFLDLLHSGDARNRSQPTDDLSPTFPGAWTV
jgi:hypothetical protein